ncbi:glycosyltransferase [Metapseudomonas lalkuanensis]|uniref:Glycosyltransferase n=1 Tax=Metapseudomonas lalkuanensis TaxID=2604832 RepID=A0A5J6QNS7_9GAMM|nr:glycosyltransferase [Pseudomonas lalkuanensis]QEY62229.1 glycosyltransferase [Pseudomonas lalkuanensis]
MTQAVLPLHRELLRSYGNSSLLVGYMPELPPENTICIGVKAELLGREVSVSAAALAHIHGLWTPFEWRASKFFLDRSVPLIMSPHGMLEPWAMAHKRLKKVLAWHLYQRRILSKARLLIVNSERELGSIRRLEIANPVAVIENGVDVPAGFDPGYADGTREKIVLFLSRLAPVKGIMDLLEAWAQVPNLNGYQLHLYGNAEPGYEEKVNACIRELSLESSVRVLGPVYGDGKWQVYRSADVFVLPSYSENFGIVVAEAMLAGLPVITTDATPWGHLRERGYGWIVKNDVNQLTNALSQAMELSPSRKREMGKAASQFAMARYSWKNIGEKYLAAYEWAKNQGNAPDFIDL